MKRINIFTAISPVADSSPKMLADVILHSKRHICSLRAHFPRFNGKGQKTEVRIGWNITLDLRIGTWPKT